VPPSAAGYGYVVELGDGQLVVIRDLLRGGS
jgi:hypothetical protein